MPDLLDISYRDRAAFYDIEYTDDADKDFILDLVGGGEKAILEIPCGVGRNVLRVARAGNFVVAADLEPEMTGRLRARAAALGLTNVETVVADLTALSLARQFDLILVPREAFQLIVEPVAALESLRALKRHLNLGGELVIDLSTFNVPKPEQAHLAPDYFDASIPDDLCIAEWTRPLQDGSLLSRERLQKRYDDGTIGVTFHYSFARGEAVRAYRSSIRMRTYSMQCMLDLCAAAGLTVKAVYGDYIRSPYRDGDARMIFVLSLPPQGEAAALSSGVPWDVIRGFRNDRDSFSTRDIRSATLRPGIRLYFEQYLAHYFSGPFLPGFGAEEILELMYRWAGEGLALDLGAGTSSLFWYLPAKGIQELSCCDIAPEALAVLDDFMRMREPLPDCYQWVCRHFGLTSRDVAAARTRLTEYLIFDCLAPWPAWMKQRRYDLITAFGNFGISTDASKYQACFQAVKEHLHEGGRAVGADWVRRRSLTERDGHDNRYLTDDLIRRSMRAAVLEPLSITRIELSDDPLYEAVLAWACWNESR